MAGLNAFPLSDFEIVQIPFTEKPQNLLKDEPRGSNWPVVYLLSGQKNKEKRIYIGETSNVSNRLRQHKENPARKYISSVRIGCVRKSVSGAYDLQSKGGDYSRGSD